jgi:hypothetical protein
MHVHRVYVQYMYVQYNHKKVCELEYA